MLAALLGNSLVGNLTFLDGGFDSRILPPALLVIVALRVPGCVRGRRHTGLAKALWGQVRATSQPPKCRVFNMII